jgi:GTP-binding protein Era
MNNSDYRSGIVSLIGKPNVGKSSLLNLLVGEKIAIVSDKIQTTRNRIGGIVNKNNAQIVFYDTPGIHKPLHKLGKYILQVAMNALNGVDLLTVILDIEDGIFQSDKLVFNHISKSTTPVIILINKIDTVLKSLNELNEEEVFKNEVTQNFIQKIDELFPTYEKIIPISVTESYGIESYLNTVIEFLPKGHPLFSEEAITDRSIKFMISEIIREKILFLTKEEIPHSVGIYIQKFQDEHDSFDIMADIIVERKSQKPIVIGKKGSMIAKIRKLAKKDMEYLFDVKVKLELFVKVKENWRQNDKFIREYTNLVDEIKQKTFHI